MATADIKSPTNSKAGFNMVACVPRSGMALAFLHPRMLETRQGVFAGALITKTPVLNERRCNTELAAAVYFLWAVSTFARRTNKKRDEE